MEFETDTKSSTGGDQKKRTQKSPLRVLDSSQNLPLPRGLGPYARGKQAEYVKDLKSAKFWYMRAIRQGCKVSSAIKDYASILHQQHKTSEALAFLDRHMVYLKDTTKVQNLYKTFEKQLVPSTNCLNKTLRIESVSTEDTKDTIKALFSDSSRILNVRTENEYAFLYFQSHSAARKTLEKFQHWNHYTIFWISDDGTVQNQVGARHLIPDDNVPEKDPMFLIGKAIQNEVGTYHLISYDQLLEDDEVPEEVAVFLLGKELYDLIK